MRVKTHVVNDKAQISHEIEKKTSLDKKRGGALEKRNERTIGDTDKANTTRGSPSAVQQKAAHFSKQQAHSGNTNVKSGNVSIPISETNRRQMVFLRRHSRKQSIFQDKLRAARKQCRRFITRYQAMVNPQNQAAASCKRKMSERSGNSTNRRLTKNACFPPKQWNDGRKSSETSV